MDLKPVIQYPRMRPHRLNLLTSRTAGPEVLIGSGGVASFGGTGLPASDPSMTGLDELVGLIHGQTLGRSLYVTGLAEVPHALELTAQLAARVGQGVECRLVELPESTTGASVAVLGLQRAVERHDGVPPLVLRLKQARGTSKIPPREQLKWAGVAVGLFLFALLLPYAEAILLKTHLAHKLLAIKSDQSRLGVIDRELDFLQYLQANEPPYLE